MAMDTHYGISVNNKFDLFLGDEDLDPLEMLRQQEEAKEKKKKELKQKDTKSAKNKKNKTVLVSQDQTSKISDDKENRKDDRQSRQKTTKQGEYNETREDRLSKIQKDNRERDLPPRRRENREIQEKQSSFGPSSPQSEFRDRPESSRGRGRGSRGRGGPRGRGGFDRFGKREFDRHSGSDKTGFKSGEKRDGSGPNNWGNWTDDMKEDKKGVKATEKREGSGAYNWGTLQDDLVENLTRTDEEHVEDNTTKEDLGGDTDPVEKCDQTEENNQSVLEDSMKEMTLDEWKAQQTQTRIKPEFNLRKAGEGCENTDWKKMFVLKKKPVEDDESEEEYYETDEEEDGRKKKMVNIEITFAESPRRGGRGGRGRRGDRGMGRGERGMGRGSGGRGRSGREGFPRGGKHADPAPNVMNDQDFPSLN